MGSPMVRVPLTFLTKKSWKMTIFLPFTIKWDEKREEIIKSMNIKNDQFAQLCPGMIFYKPWFQRMNRKVVILHGSMEEILLPNPCPLGWRHKIFCVLSYLRARFSELLPKLLYKNSNHHCVWVIANTPLITVKRKKPYETYVLFLRIRRSCHFSFASIFSCCVYVVRCVTSTCHVA